MPANRDSEILIDLISSLVVSILAQRKDRKITESDSNRQMKNQNKLNDLNHISKKTKKQE